MVNIWRFILCTVQFFSSKYYAQRIVNLNFYSTLELVAAQCTDFNYPVLISHIILVGWKVWCGAKTNKSIWNKNRSLWSMNTCVPSSVAHFISINNNNNEIILRNKFEIYLCIYFTFGVMQTSRGIDIHQNVCSVLMLKSYKSFNV